MYFYNRLENKLQTTSSYLHILYLGEKRWALKKENGYQLADDNLHILSETEYKQINHFVNGIATYAKGKYWGYVNLAGEELSGDVFGLAWDYKDGLARAAFKEGVGFLDLNQKLAFFPPPGTVDIRDFSEGLAPIQLSR
jgi:hypothetical protein